MGKQHYHDKPKNIRKDGTIEAGQGKARPHHKEIKKRVDMIDRSTGKKIDENQYIHRLKEADAKYVPRTPNKYQTQPKKINEDDTSVTYQWFEDNGHKDHVQKKTKSFVKDMDRQAMVAATITNPTYQKNFTEIFGEKKRGVQVEGGYKKFKKTYK